MAFLKVNLSFCCNHKYSGIFTQATVYNILSFRNVNISVRLNGYLL